MSKYRNKKVRVDGFLFDSLMEHQRYVQLKLMRDAGVIHDLHVHPVFKLQEKFYSYTQQKYIRPITYTADFSYNEDGKVVVEDVKGVKTAVFNLKRRIFEYRFPSVLFKVVEQI
jgi:hypothetical protein